MQKAAGRTSAALIGAAFLGCSLTALPTLSLGVLMKPLQAEFGWSRAEITSGVLISTMGAMLTFPFFGSLVDRYGARSVALTGTVLQGLVIAGLSLTGPSIMTWYAAWTIYAIIVGAASPLVWTTAVARATSEERRGFALAIALAGASVLGIVTPMLTFALEEQFGWRAAYVILGFYPILIVLPMAWFGLPRERAGGSAGTPHAAVGEAPVESFRTILRSTALYAPLIALFLNALAVGALMLHFVPMMTRFELPTTSIALLTALFGPAALVGRLGAGAVLGSRMPANMVFAGIVIPNAVAAWLLIFAPPSPIVAAAGIIFTGLGQGAALVLVPFIAGRLFPITVFGKASAVLMGAYSVGFGLGPISAGALYDRIGTYAPVGWLVMALVATAVPLALMLSRQRAAPATVRIAAA